MFKINNSYETEPSSSSSTSNECAPVLNSDWDFQSGSCLRDLLFPTGPTKLEKPSSHSKRSLLHSPISLSMVGSSQESDFCGFSPTITTNKRAKCERIVENAEQTDELATESQFSGSQHKHVTRSIECTSAQTITSEEFSDQDIRCRNDLDKDELRLRVNTQITEDLCNVSGLTIEPNSSDDEIDSRKKESASKTASPVVPTLSINENSNNAVDNAISTTSYETDLKDLSFNGILKAEPSEPIAAPQNKKDLNGSNVSDRSNLEWQLQLESSREHINERSPDLFSDLDDDEEQVNTNGNDRNDNDANNSGVNANDSAVDDKDTSAHLGNGIEKTEKTITRHIQNLLAGILPPPSVTYVQHDSASLLAMYKKNVSLTHNESDDAQPVAETTDNCMKSTPTSMVPEVLANVKWPELERTTAYGLHYNRTKYTENIEMMYMKLVERNVGQETGSSFTFASTMSSKKKPIRKLMASPGNRLSHLARRRAIFSSANLQSQSQLANLSKLGRKPLVFDASKLSRKEKVTTPKRRALGNRRTPGRKTPGSLKKSANKLVTIAPKCGTATRETSKRALFLSPTQDEVKNPTPPIPSDISRRIEKSKRALFSPPRRLERSISNISNASCSTSFSLLNNSNKKNHLERIGSFNRTNSDIAISFKRRLERDDENMEPMRNKLQRIDNTVMRAASENSMYQNHQLSASHKQKLLWAVSTSLKKKSITSSHSSFNVYGSILGKVVKRLYLESLPAKTESTSATMLRLADRLVFWVLQGKSVDEIYLEEKARMDSKIVTKRISGYINRDEYLSRLDTSAKLNGSSSDLVSGSNENDNVRKPLTNSSSKSNVGTSALRENHDSKSAQKTMSNVSFSGRNQKNLSPYNDKSRSVSNLNKPKLLPAANSSILKVKRQISFDN